MTKKVSAGGIEIPGDQTPLPFGEVVQLGPNVLTSEMEESGVKRALCEVGDIVLFDAIGAIILSHILKDHVLIESDNILAILEGEEDNL